MPRPPFFLRRLQLRAGQPLTQAASLAPSTAHCVVWGSGRCASTRPPRMRVGSLIAASGASTVGAHVAVASGTTPEIFFDTSLAREKVGSSAEERRKPRRRRTSRSTAEIPAEELAAEQQRLLTILDRAAMEDPKAIHYPLHSYREISPVIARSIAAHHLLFDYVSVREDTVMRKRFVDLEDNYKTEILGKALYLRIIHVPDKGTPAGARGSTSKATAHARAIHEGVMDIVHDYARETIEPFPGEIGCDVSHYAALAPLVAAAMVNVEQFAVDARSLYETGTIAKKGVPGKATAARRLQALTPEEVAREMATRMTREVLRPLGQRYGPASGDSSADAYGGYRVCIGIATTPVLAKIGCDAEVQHVMRGSGGAGGAVGKTAPVRVRSFHQHIRTLRDSKAFMAHFRVAHVPVFTGAFANFLRAVFKIDTCAQLYERREELYYNLSRETFKVCYDTVFGRMRFPQEEQSPLFSTENLRKAKESLHVLATNAIALANDDRTAVRGSALQLTRAAVKASCFQTLDARRNYGRLFTDAQFIDVVLRTTEQALRRLRVKGYVCGGMRVDIRRGMDVQFTVSKSFPPTSNHAELMTHGRAAAEELAPHRQQKGVEVSGEFFAITVTLTSLDLARMAPARLEAEVDRVKAMYAEARFLISHGHKSSLSREVRQARRRGQPVTMTTRPVALPSISRKSSRRQRRGEILVGGNTRGGKGEVRGDPPPKPPAAARARTASEGGARGRETLNSSIEAQIVLV